MVVDDHTLFRRGLMALIGADDRLEVVGEAADLDQALRLLPQAQPDLVLLDNHMPGVSGIQGIAPIKALCPQTHVVMLTVSEDQDDLVAALKAGAEGYLLKTAETDVLTDGLFKVMAGESVVSPEMTRKLLDAVRGDRSRLQVASAPGPAGIDRALDQLSPREREILACVARGCSNKLIARELDIAETTVKVHVQNILRKLGLSSRVQAAVQAIQWGLAGDSP